MQQPKSKGQQGVVGAAVEGAKEGAAAALERTKEGLQSVVDYGREKLGQGQPNEQDGQGQQNGEASSSGSTAECEDGFWGRRL